MSWYDKPISGGPDDGGQDEELEDPREPFPESFCEFCGGPEPCSKIACMDALAALADYWEEESSGPNSDN